MKTLILKLEQLLKHEKLCSGDALS